jgi:ABC-type uncharacterized transport system substrate-binding protein
MRPVRLLCQCSAAALAALAAAAPAAAHPHVFVDARSEVVIEANAITAIKHVWRFDEAFSLYASEGLDENRDGVLSREELDALAKVNIESLAEYGFFTFLGSLPVPWTMPTEYWLTFENQQLTLFFTLPLSSPWPVGPAAEIEVYDPEFFVDFTYVDDDPVLVAGSATGCTAEFRGPPALDPAVQSLLAEVPMGEAVPPNLLAAAVDLANKITVRCG